MPYALIAIVGLASSVFAAEARERIALNELPPTLPLSPSESSESLQSPSRVPSTQDSVTALDQVRRMLSQEEVTRAIRLLDDTMMRAETLEPDLLVTAGETYAQRGRFGIARLCAEAALQREPVSIGANFLLGDLAARRGDLNVAVGHFRAVTRNASDASDKPHASDDPRRTAGWYRLAQLLERGGYWRAAAESYGEFEEAIWVRYPEHASAPVVEVLIDPDRAALLRRRTDLLLRAGLTLEAREATASAVALKPRDPAIAATHLGVLRHTQAAQDAWDFARPRLAQPALRQPLLGEALRAAADAGALAAWLNGLADQHDDPDSRALVDSIAREAVQIAAPPDALVCHPIWTESDKPGAILMLLCAVQRLEAGDTVGSIARLGDFLAADVEIFEVPVEALFRWGRAVEVQRTELATYLTARSLSSGVDIADSPPGAALAQAYVRLAIQPGDEATGSLNRAQARLGADHMWARYAEAIVSTARYDWLAVRALLDARSGGDAPDDAALFLSSVADLALNEWEAAIGKLDTLLRSHRQATQVANELGIALEKTGDALAGQAVLQEALAQDPACDDALLNALGLYIRHQKPEVAEIVVEQLDESAMSAEAVLRARMMLKYQGPQRDANYLDAATRHLKLFPESEDLHYVRAASAIALDRLDDAASALKRLTDLVGAQTRVVQLKMRYHARALDFAEAATAQRELARRLPRDSGIHLRLAELYLYDLRLEQATETIDALLAEDDDPELRFRAYSLLIDGLVALGEFERAQTRAADLRTALPDDQRVERLWLRTLADSRADERFLDEISARVDGAQGVEVGDMLGMVSQSAKRLGTPERAFEILDRYRPGTAELGLYARVIEIDLRATTSAPEVGIDLLQQMLRGPLRNPRGRLDRRQLAELVQITRGRLLALMSESNRNTEAEAELRRWALARDATLADRKAQLELEQSYYGWTNQAEAYEARLEAIYALDPTDHRIWNDLAYSWVDRGVRLDEALALLRPAVAEEPLRAAYLDSLGWCYYQLGDNVQAERYLARALRLAVDRDPILLDHWGDLKSRMGQQSAATAAWREALDRARSPDGAELLPDPEKFIETVSRKLDSEAGR